MVGYMSLEEQVDADFTRAHRRALFRRLMARLRKDPASGRLLCFDEVRQKLGVVGRARLGRRVVWVEQITGSVGRCSEFDRAFLPAKAGLGTRWKRIDHAYHRGEEFPPVSLYKIGDSYFVADGNHRVSVARYQGVEMIDAEMTEFHAQLPRRRRGEDDPMSYERNERREIGADHRVKGQHHNQSLGSLRLFAG